MFECGDCYGCMERAFISAFYLFCPNAAIDNFYNKLWDSRLRTNQRLQQKVKSPMNHWNLPAILSDTRCLVHYFNSCFVCSNSWLFELLLVFLFCNFCLIVVALAPKQLAKANTLLIIYVTGVLKWFSFEFGILVILTFTLTTLIAMFAIFLGLSALACNECLLQCFL